MTSRSSFQWWLLLGVALAVVLAWPPHDGKSLAVTFVNWVVDPQDALPGLPAQLPLGLGDDPVAVDAHDSEVRQYDALYDRGGWTRRRLELKTAGEPFDPAIERQILTALAVLVAFLAMRLTWRTR